MGHVWLVCKYLMIQLLQKVWRHSGGRKEEKGEGEGEEEKEEEKEEGKREINNRFAKMNPKDT